MILVDKSDNILIVPPNDVNCSIIKIVTSSKSITYSKFGTSGKGELGNIAKEYITNYCKPYNKTIILKDKFQKICYKDKIYFRIRSGLYICLNKVNNKLYITDKKIPMKYSYKRSEINTIIFKCDNKAFYKL